MSEKTSVAVVERVQSAVYQLLARDQEDELKASQLLKILDDSNRLQKKIEIERINARPSQKQMFEEALAQGESQKEVLQNLQKALENANLNKKTYAQNLFVAIQNLCSSVYGIKQLQHLITINKRSQSVIKLLQKIPLELKPQFQEEEKKIEEAQEAEIRQQKLLQKIEGQVASQVELLSRKKEALKNQVEKSLILEMEQRKQYKQALQIQNEKRLQPDSHQGYLFLEDQRRFQVRPQIINRQLTENTKAKSELKIETIKLRAHYQHQKIVTIILTFVTILLLIHHFAIK